MMAFGVVNMLTAPPLTEWAFPQGPVTLKFSKRGGNCVVT